jgi:hypothetical protein
MALGAALFARKLGKLLFGSVFFGRHFTYSGIAVGASRWISSKVGVWPLIIAFLYRSYEEGAIGVFA